MAVAIEVMGALLSVSPFIVAFGWGAYKALTET